MIRSLAKKSFYILITFGIIVAFQNCGPEESRPESAESQSVQEKANFAWIDKNIVQPACVKCHSPSRAFAGLDFTTYIGVMDAVEPGEPQNSTFYTRSFTTQFFELTDEEREIIRVWILTGADY